MEFHKTVMGNRFYEGTMPRLVKAMERLADQIERLNENLEKENVILELLEDKVDEEK